MDKSIVPVNQIAVRSSTGYEFSNPNETVVVEIEDDPVEVVEKQMEELKLNQEFNEKDVPQIFKTLINKQMKDLKEVHLDLDNALCLLKFAQASLHIRFECKKGGWTVRYEEFNTTIQTLDPEKSIIDHLWLVLKNPNIKLKKFEILTRKFPNVKNRRKMDSEKLNTLLQSSIDSINHQIHTEKVFFAGFNEDMFLSMLKHVKSKKLEELSFCICWKQERNYQKMKEIVELDQWKQVERIESHGVSPLKIDDLFQYKCFWLELEIISPKIVLRVIEHAFNSPASECFALYARDSNFNVEAIIDFLRSQIDGAEITKTKPFRSGDKFCYEIVKSGERFLLIGNEERIAIMINL